MAENKPDFNFTPPQKQDATQQAQPAQPSNGPAPGDSHPSIPVMPRADIDGPGVSQNGAIIGTAIVLVLAVLFFFIRKAIRGHLIANKAPLSAAGSAGWAMFAFLMAISVTAVFGLIGKLWTILSFIIPMAVLDVVTLVLAIVLYLGACKK